MQSTFLEGMPVQARPRKRTETPFTGGTSHKFSSPSPEHSLNLALKTAAQREGGFKVSTFQGFNRKTGNYYRTTNLVRRKVIRSGASTSTLRPFMTEGSFHRAGVASNKNICQRALG
jgi:hypothetical protein